MPLLAWFILILWRVLSWTGFILLLITLGLWWQSYRGGFETLHTLEERSDTHMTRGGPTSEIAIGSINGRLLITRQLNDYGPDLDPGAGNNLFAPWYFIPGDQAATRLGWSGRHHPPQKTFLGYGQETRTLRTTHQIGNLFSRLPGVREVRINDIVVPYALCASSFALWPLSNLLIWVNRRRQGRCAECGGRRNLLGICNFCGQTAAGRLSIARRVLRGASRASFILVLLIAYPALRAWFSPDHIRISFHQATDPWGLEVRQLHSQSARLTRTGLELEKTRTLWPHDTDPKSLSFPSMQISFDPTIKPIDDLKAHHFSLLGLSVVRKTNDAPSPGFYGGLASTKPAFRPVVTPPPSSWTRILLPWYLLLTLFTLFSTPWFISVHRRRQRRLRKRKGQCPTCGYDLRATPGRCPECGGDAPNEKSST